MTQRLPCASSENTSVFTGDFASSTTIRDAMTQMTLAPLNLTHLYTTSFSSFSFPREILASLRHGERKTLEKPGKGWAVHHDASVSRSVTFRPLCHRATHCSEEAEGDSFSSF